MLNIIIPRNINIFLNENWIEIKGPFGLIKKKKSKLIKLYFDKESNKLWLLSENNSKNHFYIAMLNKLIWGVYKGYAIKLNIIGVGYKVFLENNKLLLKIGFSHNVYYEIPKDVTIKILNQKLVTLSIFGCDLQRVTQVAAEIKSLKPIEPYKGKGIKYFNEIIKLKVGKKTNV
jgi:large subunit ribosomal protein L6